MVSKNDCNYPFWLMIECRHRLPCWAFWVSDETELDSSASLVFLYNIHVLFAMHFFKWMRMCPRRQYPKAANLIVAALVNLQDTFFFFRSWRCTPMRALVNLIVFFILKEPLLLFFLNSATTFFLPQIIHYAFLFFI